jgi:hypothetical protein
MLALLSLRTFLAALVAASSSCSFCDACHLCVQGFVSLVHTVEDTGKIRNEIRDLQARIDALGACRPLCFALCFKASLC